MSRRQVPLCTRTAHWEFSYLQDGSNFKDFRQVCSAHVVPALNSMEKDRSPGSSIKSRKIYSAGMCDYGRDGWPE